MVNFGLIAAEIDPVVWGTPANFNEFRVLATLLYGTPILGISHTICGVEQRAPPVFGRAAITLGIGPHSSSSSFFRLFSVLADWMSTILPHMVWPLCEFIIL